MTNERVAFKRQRQAHRRENTQLEYHQSKFTLSIDLFERISQLANDIRENPNELILAFLRLKLAVDSIGTPLVGSQRISTEGLLIQYDPSKSRSIEVNFVTRELNRIRQSLREHPGIRTTLTSYLPEAIAFGLEVMGAAQTQLTYPKLIVLTIDDQDLAFGYQLKSQVLFPVSTKLLR
ncbi:MAG: hypothetical protein ACD_57C00006G0002 [uncultured bacterium]|nr:MAG: hypothetical protein ACD_57C00006G0002 [uncultured bacterium]